MTPDPDSAVATARALQRHKADVKLAAWLYDCRSAARGLLGDSYAETLKPYRAFISRVMREKKLPVLRATLDIGKHIAEGDPVPLMMLMAAAVEMMESSE
jgi:hypothetical protein